MRMVRGFTLIELVIFIVVVSAALAGVLAVLNRSTSHNADPQLRRQALAIAESLLEEVQLMPFTYCDPDDPNIETATAASAAGGCTSDALAQTTGPQAGETRYATPQFDNVVDYHGFAMNGIRSISDQPIAGLGNYRASVQVVAAALGDITAASGSALRITVTVTDPNNEQTQLDGWRTRFAPNSAF